LKTNSVVIITAEIMLEIDCVGQWRVFE